MTKLIVIFHNVANVPKYKVTVQVKQPRYRPGVAQRVPGI